MKQINGPDQKLKTLNQLDLFFIIAGLIEVFVFVFLTHHLYAIIVGLITMIPAYIALNKTKLKWNYFVGIWALLKFNPVGLAMIGFMLSDSAMNFGAITMYVVIGVIIIIAISQFVLGIIILSKTAKYIKNQIKTD